MTFPATIVRGPDLFRTWRDVCSWHKASLRCDAPVWSLSEVKRTSGEAAACFGPTRMTLIGHASESTDEVPRIRRMRAAEARRARSAWGGWRPHPTRLNEAR